MLIIKSSASAPGKVILFREHAVVYGVTAIAAAYTTIPYLKHIKKKKKMVGLSVCEPALLR